MIAIIDYGSGNIQAIKNIYKRLKIECEFVSTPEELAQCDKIILPGVGAFDESMRQLANSGMVEALNVCVLEKQLPVLGVCVGMQIMAKSSEEGQAQGLGWFDAQVRRFDEGKLTHKPKVPHMGWNSIQPIRQHPVFDGIDFDTGFYFLHSYFIECQNESEVFATSQYGGEFACAVNRANIFGFQFHPEKSHSNGVNLFKNFAEMSRC